MNAKHLLKAIKTCDFTKAKEIIDAALKDHTFDKVVLSAASDSNENSPLFLAACSKNQKIFNYIVSKGDCLDEHGNSIMHYAVNSGIKDLVRLLLQNKINVEARNKYNYRPLHWAAEQGDLDMVKILIEEGKAKINIKTNQVFIIQETKTPLFIAISNGHFDIAKYLVQKGADVNALNDSSNSTALTQACRMDNIEMIRFLLEHGASPNGVNSKKDSKVPDFYFFPLAQARSAEAVNVLVQHGARVNDTDASTIRPASALKNLVSRIKKEDLSTVEGKRQLEAVKALLEHGASLNDQYGAIESAAQCREVEKILEQFRKKQPIPPSSVRKYSIKPSELPFFKKKPKSFFDLLGRMTLRFLFRMFERERETGKKSLFLRLFRRKKR